MSGHNKHKTKIRQTPKKPSTFKKEDFIQRSTKSGSKTKTIKKTGGKTELNSQFNKGERVRLIITGKKKK